MKYVVALLALSLSACASFTDVTDPETGVRVVNSGCVLVYCEVPGKLIIGNKK
jgi:hypothetical protein